MSLRLYLSNHAREVMKRRQITWDEVVATVERPDIIEPHQGKKRYVKGTLCVVIAPSLHGNVVVTILLREQKQWSDEDVRNRKD